MLEEKILSDDKDYPSFYNELSSFIYRIFYRWHEGCSPQNCVEILPCDEFPKRECIFNTARYIVDDYCNYGFRDNGISEYFHNKEKEIPKMSRQIVQSISTMLMRDLRSGNISITEYENALELLIQHIMNEREIMHHNYPRHTDKELNEACADVIFMCGNGYEYDRVIPFQAKNHKMSSAIMRIQYRRRNAAKIYDSYLDCLIRCYMNRIEFQASLFAIKFIEQISSDLIVMKKNVGIFKQKLEEVLRTIRNHIELGYSESALNDKDALKSVEEAENTFVYDKSKMDIINRLFREKVILKDDSCFSNIFEFVSEDYITDFIEANIQSV